MMKPRLISHPSAVSVPPPQSPQPGDALARALRFSAISLLVLAVPLLLVDGRNLTWRFFHEQDAAPLLAIAAGYAALAIRFPGLVRPMFERPPRWLTPLIMLLVVLIAATGVFAVFGGYALTRDELLANFDADFLRRGQLIAPVPGEWLAYADALQPAFMLAVPGGAGWTSAYLPGNAAIRALIGLFVDPAFTGALLAGGAIVALHGIGRRLFPDRPAATLVAVTLLATSSQLLVTAMTPYAMTAHLALNLIWLWLFLRNDRVGDAGAAVTGFVATGLHQIIFHPLFVAPFILDLMIGKQWRRAAFFTVAYAGIGLFWASYWQIALSLSGLNGVDGGAADNSGLPYIIDSVSGVLGAFNPAGVGLMILNLLRFTAWQNPLLLPLALLGVAAIRRGDGIARPLALGVLLNLAAMLVLLPYQGHGWGYRYLHGFLGSLCLLAAYGWLAIPEGLYRQRARAAFLLSGVAAVLLLLPLHMKQAHDFVRPYRTAHAMIARAPVDIVLVDGTGLHFAADLVRYAAVATNRP
jgi:hypothetical protein